MALKRHPVGTPRRPAKVRRGNGEHRGIPTPEECPPAPRDQRPTNATVSPTTDTDEVKLPVTTVGPLQYPAPRADDDSSCSNSSIYTATTLSYSSRSDEAESMRRHENSEEQSDGDSSIVQLGDSCRQQTPAAPLASDLGVTATQIGLVTSTTPEKVASVHQSPQPNASAGTPHASRVPDTQEETADISPPLLFPFASPPPGVIPECPLIECPRAAWNAAPLCVHQPETVALTQPDAYIFFHVPTQQLSFVFKMSNCLSSTDDLLIAL
ncbi:hypothetical protein MRX96_044034 [Rhipicephalus microplus]